jgi:hypothetical protein
VPKRKNTGSGAGQRGVQQRAAQDVTLTREQVTAAKARPETGTLAEEKKDEGLVTLKDGYVTSAGHAVLVENSLRTLAPGAIRSLVALVQGRRKDADRRHFRDLVAAGLLEDDTSVPPITRGVLLNSVVETAAGPELGELQFTSAADRKRFDEARAADRELDNIQAAYRHYHGRGRQWHEDPPPPWLKDKGDGPGR